MDSSENDKTTTNTSSTTMAAATTTSSSDSTAIQDSTIFSYISNLSPLKPVKAAPVVPGFPGLNSPPIVFTSPRLNPLRETSYLKRPGCPQLSSAELSQQDVRGNNIIIGSNEFEISKTQGSSALAPCIEKECDNKGSVQDQAASPSGCIDEYLADAVEVDCANSAHLSSLSLIQSDDMPRSLNDCTDSNEITPKLDSKNNMGQDAEKALGTFPSMLEQTGVDLQGNSSSNNKPVETEMKQGGSEMPPSMCPKVESDLTIHQAFEERHRELLVAQHCGMHRRCLRFEEDPQNIMASGPDFWSPSNNVTSSTLPASPADSDVFESSCIEETATSSKRQLINLTQPTISTTFPRNSGNSRSTVSKPSGIGLHLNNAINAMPMGCGATGSMKSAEKGYLNTEGKKFAPSMGSHQPESTTYSTILSNMRERVSASSEDNSHETQASVATGSLASQSPQIVKPSNDPALLKQCEYQTTPCDKRKSISELADAVQELNQSSPKKKRINVFKFSRKKASTTDNVDGCKRCNCKKTKCLKLYCDCFAAGIYCAEPCACQGCFNTPEYEDTVLETRQQIESRNPLAFAPKILQRVTDSPANSSGDGNNSTPSSARHKRGCNCKKSMCLKKYCECYQANVGCSSGCRCEGCKNIYGRKEEYGMTKDVLSKEPIHGRFESPFDEKLEIAANQDGLLQTELCNPLNLTPLTPSFQFSDHGNDLSKSQFSTRRCLPSPESNLTLLQYGKSPGSSGNSDYHDMLLNARKDIEDVVSCHQELDYSNVHTVDEFSLRYDVFANVCDFSTLPNPPSTAMGSSASSKISDWTTISTAQLCPGSGHLSSESSLHWRSSPITPVAQFGGIKLLQAVDSDKKLHDIMEDDTPEILKDISNTLNSVRVSSPNRKCVSPPHSHLQELGSNSSAGLRSGRKFILQAVPSFPPLTPCIDSRGSSSHNINDTQDCSSKK